MKRWAKKQTAYSRAEEHYDADYFADQARDGDVRGRINAWKFEPYLKGRADILDFGCGDGALLAALGGRHGVEINPHAASAARARGIVVEPRIEEYPDNAFDLVVSNHCLEHVEDPLAELRGMRRVLRDDGLLVIVVPCHRANFAYRAVDRDFHLFSWSAANLGNIVSLAGFEVVEAYELRHRWPPKWRSILRYLGFAPFHLASWIWARLDRSASQVVCVAKPKLT